MAKKRITKPVEERRQEIIDTSRVMFMEYGFGRTQMADISKKMNVAAGTIYHYFKSKTELLYAVIDEIVSDTIQQKRQFLNNAQGSSFDRLKSFVTSFENEEHWKLSHSFSDDPTIIQYYLTKISNSFLPILESLIEQGNADDSWYCEYPAEIAVFILQGMTGVMSKEHERKDSLQEKSKRFKAYANFAFRMLDVEKQL